MGTIKNSIERSSILYEKFKEYLESLNKFKAAADYFSNTFHIDAEKVMLDLSKEGWFIWLAEGSLEDAYQRVHCFLGKSKIEQDTLAENLVSQQTDNIKKDLLHSYPDRAQIILDSFAAHDAQLYGASIPAFLALAEGICRDNFPGVGLYEKDKKTRQPKLSKLFDANNPLDVFEEVVLEPLKMCTNATKTIHEPTLDDHLMFNRHLIMHGNSKSYASKKNSLKAVALSDFAHKSLTHLISK